MGEKLQTRADRQFAEGDLLEGKYRILRPIAEGGMGAIYHARHEKLGRDVAVKVLKPIANEAPEKHHERVERFFREASFSSQLNHPNTMTIFDYGELPDYGGFFLVMEFLKGKSLRDLLDEVRAFPPSTALHIAIQVASSLADAHGSGVIHRDLKPPNVMLVERGGDPYFVKVVDFGLVKRLHDEEQDDELTAENTVIGSPMYIAPERFLQKDADSPAVDVYALGIILYEMVVGRPPFIREGDSTVHQLILKHVQEPPPPIAQFRPDLVLPEGLETLIMKCLEKDPAQRIPTMESLLMFMKSCARGLEYNPHSSISPLSDTGPVGLSRSSELLIGEETGQSLRQSTRDLTGQGFQQPQTAATQQTGSAEQKTKNKVAPIAGGIIVLLLLVAGLAYAVLAGSEDQSGAMGEESNLAHTFLEEEERNREDDPIDGSSEEIPEFPIEESEESEEPELPLEEPPAEEVAPTPPPRQVTPRQQPRPRSEPREEEVPNRPPVQIKMDR